MIKIFIALILAYSIKSDFESCLSEDNPLICQEHDYNIKNGYCYTLKNPGIPDDDGNIEDTCIPLPKDSENQKAFWNILNGIMKEIYLLPFNEEEEELIEPKKDYYKKGEKVEVNKYKFTDQEKAKVNGKNTCLYLSSGKMYEYSEAIQKDPENWKSIPFPNITDKNVCFGAEKFKDLANLMNCGYANIKLYTPDKTYGLSTCYYMPDNQLSNDFFPFYKDFFIDNIVLDEDLYIELIDGMESANDANLKKAFPLNHKKRKLDDVNNYEITIEDKYGKIIQYDKNSDTINIIAKGNQTDSDKEEVDEDQPSKIKTSSSGYSKLNMIILLSIILLVI